MRDISTKLFIVIDTLYSLGPWDEPQKYDPMYLKKII